jgi:hypothetical protein
MLIAGAAEAMILGLPVGVRAAATETAVLTPVRWCRVCNRYDGQCSKTWVEGTCWRPYQPYWQPGAVVWGYSYPMFGWAPAPQPRYAPRPYYAPGSYDEPPPGRGYYSRGR